MSVPTETVPESCPFCWAAQVPRSIYGWFQCGTMITPKIHPRRHQTTNCIIAERERLTRELAESKATIKRLEAEKAFLSESHLAQENKRLVAEMLELRNAIQRDTDAFLRLSWERDQLLARVKRLATDGDRLDILLRCESGIEDTEEWACATREMQLAMIAKAQRDWRKAKETKP